MREILFRGKQIYTNKWIEGWYGMNCYGAWPLRHAICPREDALSGYLRYEEIFPDTVGQYSGRDDKNGQKIFEGDIIKAVLPDSTSRSGFIWPLMKVAFMESAFFMVDSSNCVFAALGAFAPSVTLEVVGNIHDNPELLKRGAE